MKDLSVIIAEKNNLIESLKNKKEQLEICRKELKESNQKNEKSIKENETKLNDIDKLLSQIFNNKVKLTKNLFLDLFIVISSLSFFLASSQMLVLYIALIFTIVKTPVYLLLLIKMGIGKEKRLKKETLIIEQLINNLNLENKANKSKIRQIDYAIYDIDNKIYITDDIKSFLLRNQMSKSQDIIVDSEPYKEQDLKRMKTRN